MGLPSMVGDGDGSVQVDGEGVRLICSFLYMVSYFQEEMDCAGARPESALSLPGSQMHGHIAWLSLARLGKLQQV